jgi:4-amino-4-deoxy-L-arabinose transferase-like glycosyltransferase
MSLRADVIISKIKGSLFSDRSAIAIIIIGLIVRIAVLVISLNSDGFPENLSRPDTPGYVNPARTMAFSGKFEGTGRAPGFPVFLAFFFKSAGAEEYHAAVITLWLISIITVGAAAAAAYIIGNKKTALWTAALCMANMTAIANAQMLLSDTLFALVAAAGWLFFAAGCRKSSVPMFMLSSIAMAVGALIRPINVAFFAPMAVLILFYRGGKNNGFTIGRRIAAAILSTVIFFAILTPWMLRVSSRGAGFTIDTNTGAMLHQNGAMILAGANHTSFEEEKAKLLDYQHRIFTDTIKYPDEASREKKRMQEFRKIIAEHPFIWLKQQLFNYHILLPDLPTLSEILGASTPGRGTMSVLSSDGVFAAVRHYFNGNYTIIFILLPLIIPTVMLYLGVALFLADALVHIKERFFDLLTAAAFIEYFFFLPGAICAPRYQLPALPCAAAFAAAAGVMIFCGGPKTAALDTAVVGSGSGKRKEKGSRCGEKGGVDPQRKSKNQRNCKSSAVNAKSALRSKAAVHHRKYAEKI